jgi:hypothetical protein
MNITDIVLMIWFAATALSVGYIAYDLFTRTPEMKVMKWGWLLIALYTGPIAFVVYWLSCREPSIGTHEEFVAPLWKQAVGSTIHCLAGDATGIIVAASVTSLFGLPTGIDSIIEYVSGFSFGLLIFQALFSRDLLGGSYAHAVRVTWLPEFLSMNAVMAGMIPTMAILMSRSPQAMEPTSARFWAVMSCASVIGAMLAYPINWWLVKNGLKHGMGTERALGRGGSKVHPQTMNMPMPGETSMRATNGRNGQLADTPQGDAAMIRMPGQHVSSRRLGSVTVLTVAMLLLGVALAAKYGDFSMERSAQSPMSMDQ